MATRTFRDIWTNNTETPLERPKGLGAKEFYTDAELADLMKEDQDRVALNKEEGRPTEPGTNADVHYDYTQYGLDRGQAKLSWNLRTSLIVGERGNLASDAARSAQEKRRYRREEQRA